MAERYTRLYSLPVDLYARGAPLLIAAGALLMDNQSGQVFVQLKLRSISSRTIGSVRLLVIGRDADGKELCRQEHLYDELSAARDSIFGAKEAVYLPEPDVRSFWLQLLSVSFADGSRYLGGGELTPLPRQADLNKRLFDTELIRQYRLETGNESRFVPLETQDLWMCACGETNRVGESCYRCGQTLEHCKEYLNVERLRENKSLRLNAQAAQAALDEAKRQSRVRLLRRILWVLIPLLLVAAAALGVYVYSSRRAERYSEALRQYESGDYSAAASAFDRLGGYRDSEKLASQAKKADAEIASYKLACRLLENGRWDEAREAFLELGAYQDSAELAMEASYRKGLALIDKEDYTAARELFLSIGSYRDAETIGAHFFDRLLSEETSLNPECGGPLTTSYRYDSAGRVMEKLEHFSVYGGMEDRLHVYRYDEAGGWSVTTGQVEMRYDQYGSLIGQGDMVSYVYEYEFYPDGSVQYCIGLDALSGDYLSSVAYDEHGSPVSVQNADGTSYSLLNEYQGGHLVKQERYNEDLTMTCRTSFEYDDGGQLKRATFVTPGADTVVSVLYSRGLVYAPDAEA